ncbi:MAG: sulfatase-like hydrolase/transferase, partial [Acidobacteriaceae bacterium]|nr:sulfatase-like hydrolase/transferase [Acidobacteriaceae bacterium]
MTRIFQSPGIQREAITMLSGLLQLCRETLAFTLLVFPVYLAVEALPAYAAETQPQHPNILFIVMDDVGIDQLKSFGYGGLTPPPTPVLDVLANNGVRFRNVWAMPECSPSRAMFYEGRYPFRTNVFNAIVDMDLANSQVSPYEVTTPKVLRNADYKSAIIGKFHLSGLTNDPYGNATPIALGWDYFYGYLDAAPRSIDTTAGGVADPDTYSCGFVPSRAASRNGADSGACYFAEGSCQAMSVTQQHSVPGKACLEQGGIFVPHEVCQAAPPARLNFNQTNAYYVWPLTIDRASDDSVQTVPLSDPRARTYSTTQITDEAIRWISSQPRSQSWMATVAYPNIHTPYQQAPGSLLPGHVSGDDLNCGDVAAERTIGNEMLTAMDTEIGRLLVETGLATRNQDGTIAYDPSASNTMVIVIGDNGTLGTSVKAPFDPNRAKATTYQTGVWVPLIVSGPLVNSPGRDDMHMVNAADLFELFGEIAGVNVHQIVPASHRLDSVSMLPYLTNPSEPSLRKYNFTQTGDNLRAGPRPGTCVIGNTCSTIVTTASVCGDNGGKWYAGVSSCCEVPNAAQNMISPELQSAIRNQHFKLVETTAMNCKLGQDQTTYE